MVLKTDPSQGEYEFPFTDSDFDALREIVINETGIMVPDNKKTMMYTRLVRRLREFKLQDFNAYVGLVKQEQSAGKDSELLYIINAMTTNVTSFFRENHHFEHLAANMDALLARFGEVNIWSSACSTGQEPWSIAMVVAEYKEKNPTAKINIWATDLDSNVVAQAKGGLYKLPPEEVESNPHLKRWFKQIGEVEKGVIPVATYEIDSSLRPLINFGQMNLLKPWTIAQKEFQVVFCRNVIIYFSKDTQRGLFKVMEQRMPKDSFLYLGHSESLLGVTESFETQGRTIYVKKTDF